jgi:hypothetical protein
MPGDTFYFPDVSASQVSLSAKSATIGASTYVDFKGVTSYFLGAGIPLPTFYVYFGGNQYMGQNSLAGANFDLTYNAAGNANSISALHFRVDNYNGSYLSFEQHLASERAFAVFSINPGTKLQKWWNLYDGEHIGSRLQINMFTQLYTQQIGLQEPADASQSTTAIFNYGLPHSSASLVMTQSNYNLIGVTQSAIPDHPFSANLSASSSPQRIYKSPFYFQLNYSYGYNYDSYGLQNVGGVEYTAIWNHGLGYSFYLPGFKFGDRSNIYKTYSFAFTLTHGRNWFSVPHHTSSTSTTESISRTFGRTFNAYVSYNVSNIGDFYKDPALGPYDPPYGPTDENGVPDYGYLAFAGVSTQRAATLGLNFAPNPDNVYKLTFVHHDDFPIAVPGVFTPPPLNNLGQYLYSNWFGQPPWQLTGEIRKRLLPHLTVDVARTYYFHFGTQVWSPGFSVQFSQ